MAFHSNAPLRLIALFVFALGLSGCSLFGIFGKEEDDDELEVVGVVQQVGDDFLVVGDGNYTVTEDTEFDGGYNSLADVSVGDDVEIEYRVTDGGRVALEVEPADEGDGESGEQEVVGTVESIGDSSLVVGGETYAVTEVTEFEGYDSLAGVAVGDEVEIEYTLGDGGRIALEIEPAD